MSIAESLINQIDYPENGWIIVVKEDQPDFYIMNNSVNLYINQASALSDAYYLSKSNFGTFLTKKCSLDEIYDKSKKHFLTEINIISDLFDDNHQKLIINYDS